jgi:hypothetical protein
MSKQIEIIFEHENDLGQTGILGVDEDNRLYWNGQSIVTEQKVTLQWWVNVAFIITGLSTLALAVFEGLKFFGQL